MNTELEPLTTRLEHLEQDNASLRAEFSHERGKNNRERRRLRIQAGLALLAFLAAVLIAPGNRAAIAQGYGVTLASLNLRLTAVEAKTQFQSANPTARSTTFSGCNVFVNDGGGSTSTVTTNAAGDGLGNLIIGYNALRGGGDDRTGSHNLIVGDYNNYSSFGGLVAGNNNIISSAYCSGGGGELNTASGYCSSVSGGYVNTAGGNFSSVSGGSFNASSGYYSSVSGGLVNTSSGYYSSVSGGWSLTDGDWSGWAAGSLHSP